MKRLASWQMGLPLPFLLALRYLKSSRRDAYVSFLSVLATGGVTLGVAALILVLGGLSGLQDFLRSDVLSRTPHIEVEMPQDNDPEALVRTLEGVSGVVSAQHVLRGRGWLLVAGDAISVRALGYAGDLPRSFQLLEDAPRFEPEAATEVAPKGSLYVGDLLATTFGVGVGDRLDIVSPKPTLTPFGPQPRIHQLRVAGIFRVGRTEDDEHRVALPLPVAQRLFGAHGSRIEVQAASLEDALPLAEQVTAALPAGSVVRTWQELNRALFFALKLEKILMFIAVFLIVPVAAMSLITVLALLISSKRSEIGILQAMGAAPGEVRRAFLVLGCLLGTLGLALGGTLGIGGAWLLDRYELISPPGDIYFLDHIPFRVEPSDLLAIFLSTILLVVTSTVYAARRAAALGPVEALRT
ncbi:MAG: FtsX-like permease family protein [Acidobacteriota bacterium]